MPVAASAPRRAATRTNVPDRGLQHRNEQVDLAFRKHLNELARVSATKEKVVGGYTKVIGNTSYIVRDLENIETGERGFERIWGETKLIPKALRSKRDASDMLGGEEDEEDEGQPQEEAQMWNDDERRAAAHLDARRKKKKTAAAASSAKRQKKAAPTSASRRSDASRNNDQNEPDTSTSSTRRSTRVSNANVNSSSASSSRTPRPSSSRREPIIREDEEENHTSTLQDDASSSLHHIDEYNLRRSTRAASDDLNTLSDRMNMFEIKSEAGSDSTRVFSRESSRADPVASTSRR